LTCPDPTNWTPDCVIEGDVSLSFRGLEIPPATIETAPFGLMEFNPWGRATRADVESPRAWGNGAWSGAEWLDAASLSITILVRAPNVVQSRGTRWWWYYQQQISAAFTPSHEDLPLEFTIANPDTGGDTYLIWGRPRLLDPVPSTAARGWAKVRAGFRVLDPLIYSGGPNGLRSEEMNLPQSSGGLIIDPTAGYLTLPFCISATVIAGQVTIESCGTSETPAILTIYGPCVEPRVTLRVEDETAQILHYHGTLLSGQSLVLNTRARTALLNGVVSRRGLVSGDWFLIPPGVSEIAFSAVDYNTEARLTVEWRDAWLP
jgi:hypothetical protein